jgi:hypothetical protein
MNTNGKLIEFKIVKQVILDRLRATSNVLRKSHIFNAESGMVFDVLCVLVFQWMNGGVV